MDLKCLVGVKSRNFQNVTFYRKSPMTFELFQHFVKSYIQNNYPDKTWSGSRRLYTTVTFIWKNFEWMGKIKKFGIFSYYSSASLKLCAFLSSFLKRHNFQGQKCYKSFISCSSTGLRPIGNQAVDELIPVLSDVCSLIYLL